MQHAYRAHVQVSDDGTLTLNNVPFAAGEEVEVIVLSEARKAREELRSATAGEGVAESADALSVLEGLAGSIEGPADWAAEHDHYLYGTPKRGSQG